MKTTKSAKRQRLRKPFKNLLPPLSREEFAALRASIKEHGVLDDVVTDESDAVLDGHNRLQIDPDAPRRVVSGLTEGEKTAFTIRANTARRNLPPAQKKALLKTMKAVAAKLRAEDAKRNTQKRISELLGVSRECVAKWLRLGRYELRKGAKTNAHSESAFLADARFTIPVRIHPEIVRRHVAGDSQVRIEPLAQPLEFRRLDARLAEQRRQVSRKTVGDSRHEKRIAVEFLSTASPVR